MNQWETFYYSLMGQNLISTCGLNQDSVLNRKEIKDRIIMHILIKAVPPEQFQMWSPVKIEWKPVGAGNSFRKYEFQT